MMVHDTLNRYSQAISLTVGSLRLNDIFKDAE